MEVRGIQEALGSMKTHLELIESNIQRKIQRKAELKEFVKENAKINKEIGVLKKERRGMRAQFDNVLDFFKKVNNGETPDAILGPLFQQHGESTKSQIPNSSEIPVSVEFIGYQELGEGKGFEAMFTLHYDCDRHTSLLKRTIEKKGIGVPPHPTYSEWKKSRVAV